MRPISAFLALCAGIPLAAQSTIQIPDLQIDYSDLTGPYVEGRVDVILTVLPSGEPFSVETDDGLPDPVVKALMAAKLEKHASAYSMQFPMTVRFPGAYRIFSATQSGWTQEMEEAGVRKWSEKDARKVEDKLKENDLSIPDRLRLLAWAARNPSVYSRELRARQIPWMIEHYSDLKQLSSSVMIVNRAEGPLADPALQDRVKQLWLARMKKPPLSANALRAAAFFLSTADPVAAVQILTPVRKQLPQASVWLGENFALAALGVTERDPETGKALKGPAELPDDDFARAARSRLLETDDLAMLEAAAHRVTEIGRELGENGPVPPGYADFCAALVKQVLTLQPSSKYDCNTEPTRIAAGVIAANLIEKVAPIYPPAAKQRQIQGTVKLQAIIDKEGRISQLEMRSGPFALYQASYDAVKKWRYRPTMLQGQPVEVITEIDVNFELR